MMTIVSLHIQETEGWGSGENKTEASSLEADAAGPAEDDDEDSSEGGKKMDGTALKRSLSISAQHTAVAGEELALNTLVV